MKTVWVVRWWEEREKMKKHGRVKWVHEKASSIGPLITGDSKCCCVLAVLKPRWGAGDWQLCFTGSAGVWGHRERHYHLTTEELPQGSIKSRTGTCPCLPLEEFPSTLWLIHIHLLSFSSFLQKSVRMKSEIWHLMIGMSGVLMHLLSLFSAKQNQQSLSDSPKFFFSSSAPVFAP